MIYLHRLSTATNMYERVLNNVSHGKEEKKLNFIYIHLPKFLKKTEKSPVHFCCIALGDYIKWKIRRACCHQSGNSCCF